MTTGRDRILRIAEHANGDTFPDKLPPLSRRARVLLLAAVGLIALLLVGPRLVDAYANWL